MSERTVTIPLNAYNELIRENESLRKDLQAVREENKKLWSIAIVRHRIEDMEELIDQIMSFPSKEVMMNELKSYPQWECKLINPNYRYVKFFYFLTSNGSLSREIRHVIEQNVSIHNFCRLVVKIFRRASDRIYRPSINLTIAEIKEGLKLYGLDQQELLECVDDLESIYRRSVRRNQTSTRTIQQWSSHFPGFQPPSPSLESTSSCYSLPRPSHSSQQSFYLQNRERGRKYPLKRRRF